MPIVLFLFFIQVKGAPLETSDRVRQLPEGSLFIAGVARDDAGDYTCTVENQFGTDTVTHKLTVHGKIYGILFVRVVFKPCEIGFIYFLSF